MDWNSITQLISAATANWEHFVIITVPTVLSVAAAIIYFYEAFIVKALRESIIVVRSRNERLDKDIDVLRQELKDKREEYRYSIEQQRRDFEGRLVTQTNEFQHSISSQKDANAEFVNTLKEAHRHAVRQLERYNEKLEKTNELLSNDLRSSIAAKDRLERKVEEFSQELAHFRVIGANEVPLSSFFVDSFAGADDSIVLYGGKLVLPPLGPDWVQVASKQK